MLLVPLLSPQGWDYVLLIAAPAFFLLFDRWPSVGVAWRRPCRRRVLVSFTSSMWSAATAYARSMQLSVVTLGGASARGLLRICDGDSRGRVPGHAAALVVLYALGASSRSSSTHQHQAARRWWTSPSTARPPSASDAEPLYRRGRRPLPVQVPAGVRARDGAVRDGSSPRRRRRSGSRSRSGCSRRCLWSSARLPECRRSRRPARHPHVVLMAKFYGHELTLGQSNLLLGALLVAALVAVRYERPRLAAALCRPRGVRQAVRGHSAAVADG